MIKLKLDNEWANRHWFFIDFDNQEIFKSYVQMIPYEIDEMKVFWKYFINDESDCNKSNYLRYFDLLALGKNIDEPYFNYDVEVYSGEYMVFEFPDEETAFYFKLIFP